MTTTSPFVPLEAKRLLGQLPGAVTHEATEQQIEAAETFDFLMSLPSTRNNLTTQTLATAFVNHADKMAREPPDEVDDVEEEPNKAKVEFDRLVAEGRINKAPSWAKPLRDQWETKQDKLDPDEEFRRLRELVNRSMIMNLRRQPMRQDLDNWDWLGVVVDEIGYQWTIARANAQALVFGTDSRAAYNDPVARAHRARQNLQALPPDLIAEVHTGFWDTAGYLLSDFRTFLGTTMNALGTSGPTLVAGAAATAATGGAALPGVIAAGIVGAATEFAFTVEEQLSERGVDINNPDAVRKALEDPEIANTVAARATTKGAVIGAFDGLTWGLAGRTLSPLMRRAMKSKSGVLRREGANLVAQSVAQSATEGGGEFTAQQIVNGKADMRDVATEAIGGMGMSAPSVTMARTSAATQDIRRMLGKAALRREIYSTRATLEKVRGLWAEGQDNADVALQAENVYKAAQALNKKHGEQIAKRIVREAFRKNGIGAAYHIDAEVLRDGDVDWRTLRRVALAAGYAKDPRRLRRDIEGKEQIALPVEAVAVDQELTQLIVDNSDYVAMEMGGLSKHESGTAVEAEAVRQRASEDTFNSIRLEVEERIYNRLVGNMEAEEARENAARQSRFYAGVARLARKAGSSLSARHIFDRFDTGFDFSGDRSSKHLWLARTRQAAIDARNADSPNTAQAQGARDRLGGMNGKDATNLLNALDKLGIKKDISELTDAETEMYMAVSERAASVARAKNLTAAADKADPAHINRALAGAPQEMLAFAEKQGVDIQSVDNFAFAHEWAQKHFVPRKDTGEVVAGELGRWDRLSGLIQIFGAADESTMVHEFGHRLLGILETMDSEGLFEPEVREALFEFLKVDSWEAVQTEQHEAFAEMFERYLFDGKAPSKETKGLFAAAARLLAKAYKAFGGPDGIKRLAGYDVTPGIRNLMDRLVVADDIAQEEGVDISEAEARSYDMDPDEANTMRDNAEDERFENLAFGMNDVGSAMEQAQAHMEAFEKKRGESPLGINKFLNPTQAAEAFRGDDWALLVAERRALDNARERFGQDSVAVFTAINNNDEQKPRVLINAPRDQIAQFAEEQGAETMRDNRGVIRVEDGAVLEETLDKTPDVGAATDRSPYTIFYAENGMAVSWKTQKADNIPAVEREEEAAEPVEEEAVQRESYTTDDPELAGSQWGKPETFSQIRQKADGTATRPDAKVIDKINAAVGRPATIHAADGRWTLKDALIAPNGQTRQNPTNNGRTIATTPSFRGTLDGMVGLNPIIKVRKWSAPPSVLLGGWVRMDQANLAEMQGHEVVGTASGLYVSRSKSQTAMLKDIRSRQKRAPKVSTRQANAYAKRIVGSRKVSTIKAAHKWGYTQVKRSETRFMASQRRGSPEQQGWHLRDLFVRLGILRGSLKAQEEVRKGEKRIMAWVNMTRDHKRKVHPSFTHPMQSILAGYGLARGAVSDPHASFNSGVHELEQMAENEYYPVDTATLPAPRPMHDLTMDEFRALDRFVRQATRVATLKSEIERGAQAAEAEALARSAQGPDVPDRRIYGERKRVFVDQIRDWSAWLIKPEHNFIALDGGQVGGQWWKKLWVPIEQAKDEETRLRNFHKDKFQELMQPLLKDAKKYVFTWGPKRYTKEELIMIALNTGNTGNIEALLNGQQDGLNWDETFIREVMAALSDADLDAVVALRDYIGEAFWDSIVALEKRTKGVAPTKVDGETFIVRRKDGSIREVKGGYFPIIWDNKSSIHASNTDRKGYMDEVRERASAFFVSPRSSASTPQGFVKDRKGSRDSGRAIALGYGAISQHVSDVIHDLAYRESLIDVGRLLNAPPVRRAFESKLGRAKFIDAQEWMQIVAAGDFTRSLPTAKLIRRFKVAGTGAMLGLSITSGLKQLLGIPVSIAHVGFVPFVKAFGQYFSRPHYWFKMIHQMSPAVKERMQGTFDRDLHQAFGLGGYGLKGKALQKYGATIWAPIVMMDQGVSGITWLAAYNNAVADGKAESEARRLADFAVRSTQGSGLAADAAKVMRGNDTALAMFTWFMTPMSAIYNTVADAQRRGYVQTGNKLLTAELALSAFWSFVVPALLHQLLFDDPPDDWEEDPFWELSKHFVFGIAAESTGGIPLIRDFTGLMTRDWGADTTLPMMRMLTSLFVAFRTAGLTLSEHREEKPFADARAYTQGMGVLMGLIMGIGVPTVQPDRFTRGIETLVEADNRNPVARAIEQSLGLKPVWAWGDQ